MSRSSCTLLVLLSLALVAAQVDAAVLRGIIPVSGSTEGAFGSNFKTSLQLSNRTDRRQVGRLVFHPAGASASDADPSLPYTLEPHQTLGYDDVVAAIGATGLGSIDLVVEEGGVPVVVTRAFDDKGDQGTTGTGIALVDTADRLEPGDTATLLAPRDLDSFRFNIGIRTLAEGVTIQLRIFDSSGVLRAESGARVFPPSYFVQQPAATFLGEDVLASDAIEIRVVEGSAVLYGTVTDNTTNDPAIHVAERD